jgi:hypothetical protein
METRLVMQARPGLAPNKHHVRPWQSIKLHARIRCFSSIQPWHGSRKTHMINIIKILFQIALMLLFVCVQTIKACLISRRTCLR